MACLGNAPCAKEHYVDRELTSKRSMMCQPRLDNPSTGKARVPLPAHDYEFHTVLESSSHFGKPVNIHLCPLASADGGNLWYVILHDGSLPLYLKAIITALIEQLE